MSKRKPKRVPPRGLRYARNPGVSSLLLVNPGKPAPTRKEVRKALAPLVKEVAEKVGKKMSEQQKKQPPKRKPPRRAHAPSTQTTLPLAHAVPVMAAVPALQPAMAKRRAAKSSSRSAKRKSSTAIAIDRAVEAEIKKRFPAYNTRKRPYRGDPSSKRGMKSLERDRRSILWNLRNGPPSARKWVMDKVPRMNPGGLGQIALGIGAFFGNRYLSHAASRLPGIKSAGTFAPVLTSGLLTLATHFATKKRPDLRTPLLWGSAISLADKVIEAAVLNFFPGASKFLGMGATEEARALDAYEEPMGYLPAYQPPNGMACYPTHSGMGIDVHEALADMAVREALADSGDGMGIEVHEAVAGYLPAHEAMSGYVPSSQPALGEEHYDGTGAYVPTATGAYVPGTAGLGANDPLGNKIVADTPQERMQDAAAFMFGGPLALAKLRHSRAMRRRQFLAHQRMGMMNGRVVGPPNGGPYTPPPNGEVGGAHHAHMHWPHINVYCPPYPHHHHGHHHGAHPAHPQVAMPAHAAATPVPVLPTTPPPAPHPGIIAAAQPTTSPPPPPSAVHGLGAGGIFANND